MDYAYSCKTIYIFTYIKIYYTKFDIYYNDCLKFGKSFELN